MKRLESPKAYLVVVLMLTVFMSSSLVYGGSDDPGRDRKTPDAPEAAALFAGIGGAGINYQGIYTPVIGDIGTTAASPWVSVYHGEGAGYGETTTDIGIEPGTIPAPRPPCPDSCRL